MRKNYTLLMLFILSNFLTIKADLGTTGKVAGRITDALTGDPLPFVNIVLLGTNLGAASDIDGYYAILNIPPGTYSLKASAIGYTATTFEGINVSIDLTTKIDVQLKEATLELGQEVVVQATKPLVRKDVTSSTSIVGGDAIKELPITEINDVLQLQAGIVVSNGDIHVRGGRSGQVVYQIDGVPITDSYDGGNVVEVNPSSVQELQVISGAFNAEYGQALSGVINLVTKDGSNNFSGSLSLYSGDYVSSKDDIFWNISDINPLSFYNAEFSLSGPIIQDKAFFFVNGRNFFNEGWLYGKRDFLTTDKAREVTGSGGSDYIITQDPTRDSSYVPMNPFKKWFGQAKLSYNLFSGFRMSYNFMIERQNFQNYSHSRRLTPDNSLQRFEKSYSNIFAINHAPTNNSFYNLNFSYYFKDYHHYLYDEIYTGNPAQPTLYIDNTELQTPPYSFEVGGTDYNRFSRSSGTYAVKLDWTTQFTNEINLQFGGEFRRNEIYFKSINLVPMYDENGQKVSPFNVEIPSRNTQNYDEYLRKPMEGSAYVQSKFEAFNLIFNVGVRYDIFLPDGQILNDPSDPNINDPLKPSNKFNDLNNNGEFNPELGETLKTADDRLAYWYKDASIKHQISPRLGLAFPITENGVIHFSYGHFFQLPRYEYLYTNPDFEIGVGSGNQGLFGNADLRPQKTVKGEIGLKQQIGEDMVIDVTMFFEDFRDLTGTQTDEILVFGRDRSYSQYSNTDFGFSKGVILKFAKQLSGGFAFNLDYTYSVTKGNSSNPADARNSILGGALPETYIAPLNWDQTHTLNLSLAYNSEDMWGFSLIGSFYSGQPYTPGVNKNTNVTQNAFPRNSGIKPNIINLDLRAYKDFSLLGYRISVFTKVYNLLDLDNASNVYGDSGDPYFTFAQYEAEQINPTLYNNTLDQLFTDPTRFAQPRRVELGLSLFF